VGYNPIKIRNDESFQTSRSLFLFLYI
jgi:hypothetical protein